MTRSIFRDMLLVVVAALGAYLAAVYFGALYCYLSGACDPAYARIGFTPYIGLFFGYLFLETLILSAFGSKLKFILLGIAIVPLLSWIALSGVGAQDLSLYVGAVLVGFLIGTAINFSIRKWKM